MKHTYFSGDLICKIINGKKVLVPADNVEPIYDAFMDTLKPGQTVNCFIESNTETGTLSQLSMVHALIRKLATEIGYTFEEMKKLVKKRSGLMVDGNFKSFANCSAEELSLAIQAAIEIGKIANLNLQ
jgi:hypothetical protein